MTSSKLNSLFVKYWLLLVFVAIKLVLQFALVNPVYELHRDEFLYLDQAFHPAAGYISVPPFTSWISKIIYLLGGGLFWIRFFPALFGALLIVFAWLVVEESGGGIHAKILTSVLLVFSVLVRLNFLFQPNSFDILAWLMVFYFLIKYIKTEQIKWLFILSVVIALGLYNKYNIAFLLIGIFTGLLLTVQRKIYTKKAFYLALLLCLILFLPNVIWQIKNNFPVIHHMRVLNDSQLVNVKRTDFLIDQVKYGLVGILTLAAFWALVFYKPFKPYRFIGWTFVIVILLYTLSRAKSYYSIGLYPVLFALGGVYLEAILKKWKTIITALLVATNITIFAIIVRYLMPFQNPAQISANRGIYEKLGLLRWEDGKNHLLPQDFADMIGWREIADKALIAYKMIPADELNKTLIYCDNYGQTGALNYYNRRKMPEAYSFNTDYIYWIPKFEHIQNVIFVGNLPSKEIVEKFKEYKHVGEVENQFAREKGKKIFLLLGGNDEVTAEFYKMAEERKKSLDIF